MANDSGPVAELHALLSLDTTAYSNNLKVAKAELAQNARDMGISLAAIQATTQQVIAQYSIKETAAVKEVLAATQLLIEAKKKLLAENEALAAQQRAGGPMPYSTGGQFQSGAQVRAGMAQQRVSGMWGAATPAERSAWQAESNEIAGMRRRLQEGAVNAQQEMNRQLQMTEGAVARVNQGNSIWGSYLVRHVLLYGAVFGAARLVEESLSRVLEIERESTRLGITVEEMQNLEYSAARTGTHLETVTGAIGRLEQRVGDLDRGALKAIDHLGLNAADLTKQFGESPLAALRSITTELDKVSNVAERADLYRKLFGGRNATEITKFFQDLEAHQKNAVVLTEQETQKLVSYMAKLEEFWVGVKTAVAKAAILEGETVAGMKDTAGGFMGMAAQVLIAQFMGEPPSATPPRMSPVASHQTAAEALRPISSHDGAKRKEIPEEFQGDFDALTVDSSARQIAALQKHLEGVRLAHRLKLVEDSDYLNAEKEFAARKADILKTEADHQRREVVSALDAAGPEGGRNFNKLQENMEHVFELYRQGRVVWADVENARLNLSQRVMEEMKRMHEEDLQKSVSLMQEFGVQSHLTAERTAESFYKVVDSFRQGRTTLEEMLEAATNLQDKMEEMANRPALKEAIKMYERGLISGAELDRARARSATDANLRDAEQKYSEGKVSAGELGRYYDLNRGDYNRNRPDSLLNDPNRQPVRAPWLQGGTPPTPMPTPGRGGDTPGGGTTLVIEGGNFYTSIDDLTQMIVSRLKQQGFQTS